MDTFDITTVRRFTEDLNDLARRCDNGEGTECTTLERSLERYVELCATLREKINDWARAIFKGELAFDVEVEGQLKSGARELLVRAEEVAARGRAMDGQCYVLAPLNELHYRIADLDYLLGNWVRPKPAVSPAPRVRMPAAAEQEAAERIKSLQPLPSGWRPKDPGQLAFFQEPNG
jgi:hypothetical protein